MDNGILKCEKFVNKYVSKHKFDVKLAQHINLKDPNRRGMFYYNNKCCDILNLKFFYDDIEAKKYTQHLINISLRNRFNIQVQNGHIYIFKKPQKAIYIKFC